MTHGEAWYKATRHENIDLSKDFHCTPRNLPNPMKYEDAVKYYNTKLFTYWMTQLDDRVSILRKSQIISALMFGNTQKYKSYKDLT